MSSYQNNAAIQSHIAQWQASSLSQAEYCKEHGIKPHIFSYYKKKFSSDSAVARHTSQLVQVKLIANDALELSLLISDNIEEDSVTVPLSMYAKADLLEFRNRDSDALAVLDSISILFPMHSIADNVLFKKAEIYSKNGKIDLAATNYSLIIEKYPYDLLADDAMFNLAGLYENQLNNKSKAMELYEKILTQYPGSLYVVDARKHFRALRNDAVN